MSRANWHARLRLTYKIQPLKVFVDKVIISRCERYLIHWRKDIYAVHTSVAEWLACWSRSRVQIAAATLSANSLKQTVHTHRASAHQAQKLVAALLRVAGVTVGLAESNGSLPPGLWLTIPAGWLPRTGISSGTLLSAVEYGLPLPFYHTTQPTEWSIIRTCRATVTGKCFCSWSAFVAEGAS